MTETTAAGDPRLRLVYEESLRAVQDQQEGLNNLRSRAGQLLTAVSVIETFLVGLVLGADGRPHVATWISAVSFVLLALVCVWIVLPSHGWTFSNSATILLDGYVDADPPATLDEMHRSLAVYMERHWDRNRTSCSPRDWSDCRLRRACSSCAYWPHCST